MILGCKLSALIYNCPQKARVHIQILNNVALISISYGLVGAFCILCSGKICRWLLALRLQWEPALLGALHARGDVPQRRLAWVLSAWVMHFVTERKGLLGLCQVSSCSVTSIDQLQHVQFHGKWCWVCEICLNNQFVHTWYFTFLIPTTEILLLECLTCHLAFGSATPYQLRAS